MHVEFDSGVSEGEATAIIAMLHALHPSLRPKFDVGQLNVTIGRSDAETAFRTAYGAGGGGEFAGVASGGPGGGSVLMSDGQIIGGGGAPTYSEATGAGDLDPATAFAAPIPTPATPADGGSPVPSAETDTDGLPWDARIHASTRGKNADGRWKARRNTPADTVASVTAELRQVMGAPAAPQAVAPPPPPPPAPPVTPPAGLSASIPIAGEVQTDGAGPTATTVASPSSAPPPPPPAPTVGAQTFTTTMTKVTAAQAAGTLTTADVSNILADFQLANLRDLITNPDKIGPFNDQVDAYIASAG